MRTLAIFNCQRQPTYGDSLLSILSFFKPRNGLPDCHFVHNRASVNERDKKDPRPHAYVISGSGGALLVRLVGNGNAQMVVADCVFSDNSAEYSGGGINILIANDARNNSALIRNCSFDSHRATEYGGGIFVDVFSVRENNSVIIEDSVFRSGFAQFGGGGVGIFQEDTLVAPTTNSNNILTIKNCTFDNNTAPDGGSAVGMVSRSRVDQSLLLTSMRDCVFTNNNATVDGTVLVIRFGAAFEGTNNFTGNIGGGVVLVLARMESKGKLWFEGNTAKYGAGISMQDRGLVNLGMDTKITFLENQATSMGGALQLRKANQGDDRRSLSLFNTFCFIQYRVEEEGSKTLPPHEWSEVGNVDVSFLNNTAGLAGAALYASDLNECSFTGISYCLNDSNKGTVYDRSIFTGPPFTFSNNQVIGRNTMGENEGHNAATDPDNFTVGAEPSFKASPGDIVTFVIEMFDQSGNRREGIWSLRQIGVHSANISENMESTVGYYSVSDVAPKRHPVAIKVVLYPQDTCSEIVIEKETGDHQHFEFSAIQAQSGEVISEKIITLNITCCHPGYYYNSPDGMNGTCVLQSSYSHLLRREESNRYIYLEPGYYAGFYNDTSTGKSYFSVALLPTVFQNCTPEGNRIGCLYEYDSQDNQCVDGRSGYMCGSCSMNKGVDMTLRTCKTCHAWDTVVLTIICVLILVFSAIVLVFNIGLPNDLKGFLFYAQVVGFAYLNGAQNSSWDFHLSRFLGFSLYLPICPFRNLSALWTAAFGFLPSILAIFTVITYIMCARFIKPLSQRTAFSGIWLLFLFVYKFTADTTANVLKCVRIQAEGSRNYLAFYYDGSVQCFAGEHLILAIPSLILLVVVVVLAPAFIILISFKRYRFTQPFTDVITKGIKIKYRWWSGFDLLRRLLFIVVATVFDFSFPAYTQLALCFSTLIVLAVLCATKPYEKTWINFVEGLILLDLLLIVIRFLNEEEYRNPYASSTNTFNYFSIVYLLLPFIYAIVNVTIRIIHMLWTNYIPVGAVKMKEYITQRLYPQHTKGKPLLKGQKSFDLPEPPQTRYSGEAYGDMEYTVQVDEGQHVEVDYSELREELLESYNN